MADMVARALAAAAAAGIAGTTGKRYRMVACVLRNTGAGWFILDNENHHPVGVASVTNTDTSITLTYDFVAKAVGSLICTPDETYVMQGFSCAASVGLESSTIYLTKDRLIAGYLQYNGTDWVVTAGSLGVESGSYTGGVLTVTHEPIGLTYARNCYQNNGLYLTSIVSTNDTTTGIGVRNHDGTIVVAPAADMKIYFSAHTKQSAWNPNLLTAANGNLWVFGVFEV